MDRRSSTVVTVTHSLSFCWTRWIQSMPFLPISLRIHFNIILPFTPMSSKWSLSFGFSTKILYSVYFSFISYVPHARQSHPAWFGDPSSFWLLQCAELRTDYPDHSTAQHSPSNVMTPHTAQTMRHRGTEPARSSAIEGDTKIPEPANTPTSCKIQYSRTPLI